MPRVLILCTGNSARSQMAEGFLRSLGVDAVSAGTEPAERVNRFAIEAMAEAGIDISGGWPKHVDRFLDDQFDHVITVCGSADQACPAFRGEVKHRVHIGFPDPAAVAGPDEEKRNAFRAVRDDIARRIGSYFEKEIERR
ncbi:MAG: arsenate reductase ArsC [Bryobacteraceae bacterium]